MVEEAGKSGIFISYSHKDETDALLNPKGDRWLTFVTSHLGPAEAHGHLEVWDDRKIEGGDDWRADIEKALDRCAVCILLALQLPFRFEMGSLSDRLMSSTPE